MSFLASMFGQPCCAEFQDHEHVGKMEEVVLQTRSRERRVDTQENLEEGAFLVEIVKDAFGSGVELECCDSMLLVAKLRRGPMRDWNARHVDSPGVMVRPGDRILRVNGLDGPDSVLIEELRREQDLRLVLRHAAEMEVLIDKAGAELGMGVVLGTIQVSMLKISALKDGRIGEWNREQQRRGSELQVMVGDRITSVNGVHNDAQKMLLKLQSLDEISMVVIRPG